MRWLLLTSAIVTLVIAALWFPMGVAEYAILATTVSKNHREMTQQGTLPVFASSGMELIRGMEERMARQRKIEAWGLAILGVIQFVAAVRMVAAHAKHARNSVDHERSEPVRNHAA